MRMRTLWRIRHCWCTLSFSFPLIALLVPCRVAPSNQAERSAVAALESAQFAHVPAGMRINYTKFT